MRRDKVNTLAPLCPMHPNSWPCAIISCVTYCRANFLLFYFSFRFRRLLLLLRSILLGLCAVLILAIVDVFRECVVCVCVRRGKRAAIAFWIETYSTHYSAPLSYIFMCLTMNLFSANGKTHMLLEKRRRRRRWETIRRWMGQQRRQRRRKEWSL